MSPHPLDETILHLARRAIKDPTSLYGSEVRRLGAWVQRAFKLHEREFNADRPPGNHMFLELKDAEL